MHAMRSTQHEAIWIHLQTDTWPQRMLAAEQADLDAIEREAVRPGTGAQRLQRSHSQPQVCN